MAEEALPRVDEAARDALRRPEAGGRVVRGGLVRGGGYAASTAVGLATAILLLRYLGVEDFGTYATVMAIVGIVAGVTDAGLTAVGGRELAIRATAAEQQHLLNNLLALRIAAATVGVLVALAFTLVAGYGSEVVLGTAVAGVAVVLTSAQSMLTVPIWVNLQIVSLTSIEVLRNVLGLVGIAVLVVVGAALLPFFAVQIAVAAVLVPVTLRLARVGPRLAAGVRAETLRLLVRETIPLAVAFAMSVIYLRVLVVLVSLLSTERETGLYGMSFRIFEILLGAPALVLSVALPLLAVAGAEDEERLRYGLRRMTEASLLLAALLVVGIAILAEPAIRLIGGEEYEDAAGVLRVQALALVPLFAGQAWALGLVAGRAQRAMAAANGVGLIAVLAFGLALVPAHGAVGAAWAAVAAELVLAAALWVALARMRPGIAPPLGFAWKVALAAAVAAAAGWALRDLPLVAAVAATVAYVAVALLVRAVPPDLFHALGVRRGGGGTA